MSWDQAARTAAIRVKPTEEWEIELIGERAWEVAFIEGARWQRKHAGEKMSDLTGESCGMCRGYGESLGIYTFGTKCQPCDGRGYIEYEEEGDNE